MIGTAVTLTYGLDCKIIRKVCDVLCDSLGIGYSESTWVVDTGCLEMQS